MSIYESEEAFTRFMDDLQVIYSMKAGQVVTADDVASLNRLDEHWRENDERATDAYHRGWQDGLRENGGEALVKATKRASDYSSRLAVEKLMRKLDAQRAFAEGAAACRETMARFVEQGGDAVTANSIRLNWNPSWGPEPADASLPAQEASQ